ncbi:23S rRNA (adenine(2503)-C(2))-methyltransferase RlmN [Candidatus Dependentiae bacterium]|nr:23S rRNA (adenine(2503)-C(2))-methyltransferase RlmN [Candidatus Dependentiae bacterium]
MDSILNFTNEELKIELIGKGYKKFRADQIYLEIYKRYVLSFEEMTEISKLDRKKLSDEFSFLLPNINEKLSEKETGTTKYSIKLLDDEVIETVLIFADKRRTQCLSSQVGCPLGCTFCATAGLDYKRSLSVSEYISQVLLICKDYGKRPTNLVFMGMGEPLLNLDNLIKAIQILIDPSGLDFGLRKITVSTCGLLPELENLLIAFPNIGIAVSLNSTFNDKRNHMMPINKKYSVEDIFNFLIGKKKLFKRRPTIEYVLIKDINDSTTEAGNLLRLTGKIRCKINLIPFNPFPGTKYKRATEKKISIFKNILMTGKNAVTFRESAGTDIFAACGQLARLKK